MVGIIEKLKPLKEVNKMNIITLALLEVKREGKINNKNMSDLLIDRAIIIRKYLDMQNRNKKVAQSRYAKI